MPAIQELSEKIEAYPGRIREAKEKKHYTIENIVDLSGVSTSSVGKLLSGVQIEPRLYNSAAICKVLDLSLDELFGLDKPVDTNEGLQQKIHELELENASLRGEVARLETVERMQSQIVTSRRTVVYVLLALCAVLAFSLAGYLAFDLSISDVGLIQNGNARFAAILLVVVIVAAAAMIVHTIIRVAKKRL